MTDTHEKFMEAAERVWNEGVVAGHQFDYVGSIAKALSQAHQDGIREGKRQAAQRAAEIVLQNNNGSNKWRWVATEILSTITDESE